MTNKVASGLNINALPNEASKKFKGTSMLVVSQKITKKGIIWLSNFLKYDW